MARGSGFGARTLRDAVNGCFEGAIRAFRAPEGRATSPSPSTERGTEGVRSIRVATFAVVALVVALGVLLLQSAPAYAADPVVTGVEVQLPDKLTVGDRLRYVITTEVDAGSTVAVAPAGLPESLRQTERLQTKTKSLPNGRSEVTVTLEVAAFVPGQIEVPPIKLRARAPGGATTDFETPASNLTVQSVLPAGGGVLTPRDLKPQAEIGTSAPMALYAALAAMALGLLLILALIVWRMRRIAARAAVVEVVPVAATLPAEDQARRVLDGAAEMLAAHDYEAYYSTLSTTVRTYLTDRFGFPAFALTTTELQERMVSQGMDRWQARLVAGLLNQCDAVVFAQYRPAPDRADADLTAAYEIVEMSRPVVEDEVPVS